MRVLNIFKLNFEATRRLSTGHAGCFSWTHSFNHSLIVSISNVNRLTINLQRINFTARIHSDDEGEMNE